MAVQRDLRVPVQRGRTLHRKLLPHLLINALRFKRRVELGYNVLNPARDRLPLLILLHL